MDIDIKKLQEQLCRKFCADIKIVSTSDKFMIETPFMFPDGDSYQIYLEPLEMGGFRLKDGGHTLMYLSYENDIDSFQKGRKNILLENIKAEFEIKEDNGEFFINCLSDEIVPSIFKLGQALTKICDITFLNRVRVQKTFYEDLHNNLIGIISQKKIEKDYIFTRLDNAKNYPIDYHIKNKREDFFFIFGVPNKDKAQLTTIILERILRKQIKENFKFNSLTVFDDMGNIPDQSLQRLLNVGGEVVSLTDKDNFKRKVEKAA